MSVATESITEVVRSNITRLREQRGLTKQDLAVLAGTTRPRIANTEHGTSIPSLGLLERIADALDTTVASLCEPP